MNKKLIFQRTLLLILFYTLIFCLLVVIQFTKQGGFTRYIGRLTITGYFREANLNDPILETNGYFLTGETSILYGGMEFRIGALSEGEVFKVSRNGEAAETLLADRVLINNDSASFKFARGGELQFISRQTENVQELLISFDIPEENGELFLPIRPQGRTAITNSGNGTFIAIAGGNSYSFINSRPDGRLLTLRTGETIRYRLIPDDNTYYDEDFIIPQARTKTAFEASLNAWQTENFLYWNQVIGEEIDEELVIAFLREAIKRSVYREAVSAIPQTYYNHDVRTHLSSVFLGGLDWALPQLLEDSIWINGNYTEEIYDMLNSQDTSIMDLHHIPEIFQKYMNWKGTDVNPYALLINDACNIIYNTLKSNREKNKVFVFYDDWIDTELNLHLGKALLGWAESRRSEIWATLARSLILSVLSMGDNTGSVSAVLFISEEGEIIEDPSSPRLTSARLYNTLNPGEYSPRLISLGEGIWAWTAAQGIKTNRENNVLNIAVNFPLGENHYMILCGIQPFTRIELYDTDWPTDPQFERYNSSGWVYVSSEQSLLLKMSHRSQVEYIRIFY